MSGLSWDDVAAWWRDVLPQTDRGTLGAVLPACRPAPQRIRSLVPFA